MEEMGIGSIIHLHCEKKLKTLPEIFLAFWANSTKIIKYVINFLLCIALQTFYFESCTSAGEFGG
jgi:hypothetical protein